MRTGSFSSKLISSHKEHIYLVICKANGCAAWHYLCVERLKLPLFEHLDCQSGSIELKEYGQVLASGWGIMPPKEVQDAMIRQYT